MRTDVKKKLILAAASSVGLFGVISYPNLKSIYPFKSKPTIQDDYVDLPTATDDLTKDTILPESVGAGTDIPIDKSHWFLLSQLRSKNETRRERALIELASQRRWNDAECIEIAQALDRQDVIKLARTVDADLRLFLPSPSVEFIEKTLASNRIEKLVKSILKEVAENSESCSSCTNFYTNLSIRVRPDSNLLAMSDFNQLERMMHVESRRRKKSAHYENVIKLKAVLNNIICGESQAISMCQSGMMVALLYFRHKYKDDPQINGLLSQILANISVHPSTREYLFTDGWIQSLAEYSRSEHLELSLPAFKALANLDCDAIKKFGFYGNHIYLLSPLYREHARRDVDVIFVHGLVGSVFKSWRQGSVELDRFGNTTDKERPVPTTELLPSSPAEAFPDDPAVQDDFNRAVTESRTRCWPKDWLSRDVPNLRILAVDYPTALSNWRTDCDLNKDTLRERAILVMKQLEACKVGDREVIWVAHSMGGLLVKQILVICDEQLQELDKSQKSNSTGLRRDFLENLLKKTKGVVFYSVPHKGSNLDWIERRNLQKLLLLTTEVIELQKGSPILVNLHDKFLKLIDCEDIDIKFLTYAEDSISSFGVNKVVQWKGVLVHEDSLQFEKGPIHKLHIDHAHTCKPDSRDSLTYAETLKFIRDLVPRVVEENEDDYLTPFISFIL